MEITMEIPCGIAVLVFCVMMLYAFPCSDSDEFAVADGAIIFTLLLIALILGVVGIIGIL